MTIHPSELYRLLALTELVGISTREAQLMGREYRAIWVLRITESSYQTPIKTTPSIRSEVIVMVTGGSRLSLQLVGAAFGAAGQRCMALSTAVFVGEAKEWLPEVVEKAKKLRVSGGMEPGTDLGPLISPEAKERVCSLVQAGVDEGAKVKPQLCGFIYMYTSWLMYSWHWMGVVWLSPDTRKETLWVQRSWQM